MHNLAIKYQILITPVLLILLLSGLVWFTLGVHEEIHQGNETVRQWGRSTDYLHTAIGAAERMKNIAQQLRHADMDQADELSFSYLEQSRIFSDNMLQTELLEKIPLEIQTLVKNQEKELAYQENLDAEKMHTGFQTLIPQLENLYGNLWAQKRTAYIDYYENFQLSGARLSTVSLSVLTVCVIIGIILSLWSITVIRRRLRALNQSAHAVCSGQLKKIDKPAQNNDELDELTHCLSDMTHRLINVYSVEKVLEGADKERQRIAMDLHDQTLSQLTSLARQVESSCQDEQMKSSVYSQIAEIENGIRQIIDELHPRVLDILGLEPAIRTYLEKRTQSKDSPNFYLSVDKQAEKQLTDFQRMNFYRIALEASHNILKHAECTQFEITLRKVSNIICLNIEDDGKGFATDNTHTGFGMSNIAERAKTMGADISWANSRFSSGTQFQLSLSIS